MTCVRMRSFFGSLDDALCLAWKAFVTLVQVVVAAFVYNICSFGHGRLSDLLFKKNTTE